MSQGPRDQGHRGGSDRHGGRQGRAPDYRNKEKSPDGLNQEGHRLVLGQQPVREVIRVWGARTHQVLLEASSSPRAAAMRRFAQDHGIEVKEVTRGDLDRLAGGTVHQGVAALAPPLEFVDWSNLLVRPDLLAIALDGVVDPQNFGAVIRSAVGIARAPIIWPASSSAPLSPATFRASAGAIEHAELCRVDSLHGTLAEAARAGVSVLGLAPEAEEQIHTVTLRGPTIVVIGSEQKGMGRSVRKTCTQLVRLHQAGTVQSLNASVAAGIAMHHASINLVVTNT